MIFLRLFGQLLVFVSVVWLGLVLAYIGLQAKGFNSELQRFNDAINGLNSRLPHAISALNDTNGQLMFVRDAIVDSSKQYHSEFRDFNIGLTRLNELLPYLINESYLLRKEVPGIVSDVEGLIGQAGKVSKSASEGAVQGAMRGILSLPSEVISSVLTLPFDAAKKTSEKASRKKDIGDGSGLVESKKNNSQKKDERITDSGAADDEIEKLKEML